MRETAKQTNYNIAGYMLMIIMEYLLCTRCCVEILYISSLNLVSSLLRHYINHLITMLCFKPFQTSVAHDHKYLLFLHIYVYIFFSVSDCWSAGLGSRLLTAFGSAHVPPHSPCLRQLLQDMFPWRIIGVISWQAPARLKPWLIANPVLFHWPRSDA